MSRAIFFLAQKFSFCGVRSGVDSLVMQSLPAELFRVVASFLSGKEAIQASICCRRMVHMIKWVARIGFRSPEHLRDCMRQIVPSALLQYTAFFRESFDSHLLARCVNLREIYTVAFPGLLTVLQKLPSLTILETWANGPELKLFENFASLKLLVLYAKTIRDLRLPPCLRILFLYTEAADEIPSLTGVKHLMLTQSSLVRSVLTGATHLESLKLPFDHVVSAEEVALLSQFPSLKRLGASFSEQSLQCVSQLLKLDWLFIQAQQDIAVRNELPNVRVLGISVPHPARLIKLACAIPRLERVFMQPPLLGMTHKELCSCVCPQV